MAKKPTPEEEPVQYPSLLVPLLEIRDDPNKVIRDRSGTFIDDKPLSDGEQADGGNPHGSQELVQVYPIGTGALVEEQLGKGGPETSDSERATGRVPEPRRPGRAGREDRGCGHGGRSRPHSSSGEYSRSAYHIG